MADKEELFELVDEQDNVIGTELRSVVHTKGAPRRHGVVVAATCSAVASELGMRPCECFRRLADS